MKEKKISVAGAGTVMKTVAKRRGLKFYLDIYRKILIQD